jgi:hypothetical protein
MEEFESLDAAKAAVNAKATRAGATVIPYELPPNVTIAYPNIVDGSLAMTFQEHRFIKLNNGNWKVEEDEIRGSITS